MSDFDKTKPAGTTKVRLSDDQIRANWDAIEDALVRMGMKFPSGYGVDAGELLVPIFQKQTADPDSPAADKLKLYAKTVGSQPRLYIKDPGGNVNPLAIPGEDIIPSGTKMLFYQDTAPTGWTIDDTLDEKLVYVTKGSAAGGETGGGDHSGGSWTISGFDANIGDHTLTTDEIPSHQHTVKGSVNVGAGDYFVRSSLGSSSNHTESAGGGQAHSHSMAAHDGTWRPDSFCCIICEKD